MTNRPSGEAERAARETVSASHRYRASPQPHDGHDADDPIVLDQIELAARDAVVGQGRLDFHNRQRLLARREERRPFDEAGSHELAIPRNAEVWTVTPLAWLDRPIAAACRGGEKRDEGLEDGGHERWRQFSAARSRAPASRESSHLRMTLLRRRALIENPAVDPDEVPVVAVGVEREHEHAVRVDAFLAVRLREEKPALVRAARAGDKLAHAVRVRRGVRALRREALVV